MRWCDGREFKTTTTAANTTPSTTWQRHRHESSKASSQHFTLRFTAAIRRTKACSGAESIHSQPHRAFGINRGKMAGLIWTEPALGRKRGRGGRGLERPRAGACGRMLAGSQRGGPGRGDRLVQRKGCSSVCQAGIHTDSWCPQCCTCSAG
jgi:hypothetical protein